MKSASLLLVLALAGSVVANSKTLPIYGASPNLVRNIACDPCGRLDLLLGYRYLNLSDDLTIQENLNALPGSTVAAGSRFQVNDRFRTENQFHGPMVGFAWERRSGHWATARDDPADEG